MAAPEDVLTVAEMKAAEQALIDDGVSEDELMQRAGRGAAEYVWRVAAGGPVTVLCGPGNNGGDGYVIAEAIRERGGEVRVAAAMEPATDAAKAAKHLFQGNVADAGNPASGAVFVDCLFGSGQNRPLAEDLSEQVRKLRKTHEQSIAIDLPSGIESDSGALLNDIEAYDLTIALGAWKWAHWTMPAAPRMGCRKLVDIGVQLENRPDRAVLLTKPKLNAPVSAAHKYTRGLLAVVAGEMPGAALLAAKAAQHAGAGYVKLLTDGRKIEAPADIVVDNQPLAKALGDKRISAVLIGSGLGRGERAEEQLTDAMTSDLPMVCDADALTMLRPEMANGRSKPLILTPHEGELNSLAMSANIDTADKRIRALALATKLTGTIVAKGPDTLIASPDGSIAVAPPASSWLSTAGTGDVLAGIIASRLAIGESTMNAAKQGVWLHCEAARLAGPAFAASDLVKHVAPALGSCL